MVQLNNVTVAKYPFKPKTVIKLWWTKDGPKFSLTPLHKERSMFPRPLSGLGL